MRFMSISEFSKTHKKTLKINSINTYTDTRKQNLLIMKDLWMRL